MAWTRFMDMHSGGGQKLEWPRIYIEAPEEEAKRVFYAMFERNPDRVTCTCCGPDYSTDEDVSLEQATAYDRGCDYAYFRPDGTECPQDEAWTRGVGTTPGYTSGYAERQRDSWNTYIPLDEYVKTVKVVRADEIKPEHRAAHVPREGYVWVNDDE